MKSALYLNHIPLHAIIGVYPHERETPQRLILSIKATLPEVLEDSLEHTVNYDEIIEFCQKIAQRNHYQLIEILAQRLYKDIKSAFALKDLHVWVQKSLKDCEAIAEAYDDSDNR